MNKEIFFSLKDAGRLGLKTFFVQLLLILRDEEKEKFHHKMRFCFYKLHERKRGKEGGL